MIDYDHPSITDAILNAYERGVGIEALIRAVRALPIAAEWTSWSTPQKQAFNRALAAHYQSYSAKRYATEQFAQLRDGEFAFWVFKYSPGGCNSMFAELDGCALSPDDGFWKQFYPPHCGECGCYVIGARSEAGVTRLGGDPAKVLPAWARDALL